MASVGARFGHELRAEREHRGISIERLCSDTKVNRRFIEALEGGDYRALPGGVFRRGFVRAYLKAVGLEEMDWLPRFETSYGDLMRSMGVDADNRDEAWATFAVNVKRNRGTSRRQFWKRWLGVLAMLLALMAAGWAVWHSLLAARVKRGDEPPARTGQAQPVSVLLPEISSEGDMLFVFQTIRSLVRGNGPGDIVNGNGQALRPTSSPHPR